MHYRFFEEPDFEVLQDLERRLLPHLAEEERRTGLAALRFYSRSGHSFLAEDEAGAHGFLLAQPVWQGDRATVLVTRAVADAPDVLTGLLNALVKSAYDAAAYEVALLADPERDPHLLEAAAAAGLREDGRRLFARVLGSRGAEGATRGVLG